MLVYDKNFFIRHDSKLMTEDVYFFQQIREKGHKVWVNPNLFCTHIGEKEVGLKEYLEKRQCIGT